MCFEKLSTLYATKQSHFKKHTDFLMLEWLQFLKHFYFPSFQISSHKRSHKTSVTQKEQLYVI